MNLVPYVKASYPVLWILTSEEWRAELTVLKTAKECKRNLRVWSHTDGFFTPDPNSPDYEAIDDPIEALEYIKEEKLKNGGKIYIFRDLHPFFQNPRVVRLVRDIATSFKQQGKTLIVISPINKVPPELERDVTLIEFDLPQRSEIEHTFDLLYKSNKKVFGKIEEDERERIVQAAMGLTTVEAEAAFAKAAVERASQGNDSPISVLVMQEKAAAVKKTGILEWYEACETSDDIGGLENLKAWLLMRSNAFSKKARDFGLPMPKGICLAGLPGCGKSLIAKAASNVLGVPLIRLDIGRVFGGLVGESEKNMRTTIQTVEAVGNCILWIDEMEKAFAGMMDSRTGDSGTSQRVFGSFITWMQEKKSSVFIVATVNRISGLPPEMLRKGRFDEIFFVGLPSEKEREEILRIHIDKYGRDASKFDFEDCVKESEGFSGAELEFAVVSGLYYAFHHDRDLEVKDVLRAIRETNPLSRTKQEELTEMVKWAQLNAMNASIVTNGNNEETKAGRQLEL